MRTLGACISRTRLAGSNCRCSKKTRRQRAKCSSRPSRRQTRKTAARIIENSMSYLVLARKYRPQKFSDVIGQEHVTRTLQNALEQGRIAHGYIFSGHRGIGKTTVARILAAALNCRSKDHPV